MLYLRTIILSAHLRMQKIYTNYFFFLRIVFEFLIYGRFFLIITVFNIYTDI